MTKSTDSISTEQEFSKLQQALIQTAEDAVNCLRVLKGNLADYDKRNGLHFGNTSKFCMRSSIRTAKDTASELRAAANQIDECESPTESDITASRSAWNAMFDAMNELRGEGSTYDKKNVKSKGITGVVAGLLGGKKGTDHATKERYHEPSNEKVHSVGILRTPDTVEEVIETTLRDYFGGFSTLKEQISTAEKSLSTRFTERSNETSTDTP